MSESVDWSTVNLPPRWRFIRRRSVIGMHTRMAQAMDASRAYWYSEEGELAIRQSMTATKIEILTRLHGHPHVPDSEGEPVCCPTAAGSN